ncbi:MAG: three-Cys-motif partner protein TcmP [Bacteroidia bacterium]
MFSSSMKNKWNLIYIDLFSGAGYTKIRENGAILKSSATIAMSVPSYFDYYIFNELDKEKYDALSIRAEKHKNGSPVKVFNLDANVNIDLIIKSIPNFNNGKGNLIFCFVDPFSLDLNFSTIKALAAHKIDILLLLALQMDGRRNFGLYIDEENTRIEEFLDNKNWRQEFQNGYTDKTFIKFLSDHFDNNMKSLGYLTDLDKQQIKTDSGLGLYYMAFYSKHPLGNKFFNTISKSSDDQLTLF